LDNKVVDNTDARCNHEDQTHFVFCAFFPPKIMLFMR